MFGFVFYLHVESTCMTASLRGEVWAHKSSLIPQLLIEVPVPRQDSERSILLLSTILMFDFGIFLTLWYFFYAYIFYDRKSLCTRTCLIF